MTIIYYTDNSLDDKIFKKCQDQLLLAAGSIPIVSVSQRPIELGKNICVGDIGRSYHSYYTQILEGLKNCNSENVATVEHDCLYSAEHFEFIPPQKDIFYYNINVWFVNCIDGKYSYYSRKAQSQLICNRQILIKAIEEKLLQTETGYPSEGRAKYKCEPGVCDHRIEFIEEKKKWCNNYKIQYEQFRAEIFKTEIPNIDIRHKSNFSIPGSYKKSNKFTFTLPYWGKFNE